MCSRATRTATDVILTISEIILILFEHVPNRLPSSVSNLINSSDPRLIAQIKTKPTDICDALQHLQTSAGNDHEFYRRVGSLLDRLL